MKPYYSIEEEYALELDAQDPLKEMKQTFLLQAR